MTWITPGHFLNEDDQRRLVRGHPFTTSTQRGGQAQVDACGWRGKG